MLLPAALRFVLEPLRWTREPIPDSAPTKIARLLQAQEQPMRRQFCLLFLAEISSALSSFLLVVRVRQNCAANDRRERKVERNRIPVKRESVRVCMRSESGEKKEGTPELEDYNLTAI